MLTCFINPTYIPELSSPKFWHYFLLLLFLAIPLGNFVYGLIEAIIIWKNIIMTIVLLSIPVINFGIFSFPYIALGLVRLFFSLNYKTELQYIFEIIPFGYSFFIV